jgi:hypothetical protein
MERTPDERSITRDVSRKVGPPTICTANARMKGGLWRRFCLLLCSRFWDFCVSPGREVPTDRGIGTESVA